MPNLITRAQFEALIETQDNGCALWRGPLAGTEPISMLDGERLSARRIAWYYRHGTLPARLWRCPESPLCVSPDHTTEPRANKINELLDQGMKIGVIAKELNISYSLVSLINAKRGAIRRKCRCGKYFIVGKNINGVKRTTSNKKYHSKACSWRYRNIDRQGITGTVTLICPCGVVFEIPRTQGRPKFHSPHCQALHDSERRRAAFLRRKAARASANITLDTST